MTTTSCKNKSPTEPQAVGTFIGVEGGTVTVDDVTLVIPAGVLDETTDVVIESLTDAPFAADQLYINGTAHSIKPEGLGLQGSGATLRIRYEPGNIPAGHFAEHLRITEREQQQWRAMAQNQVRVQEHTVEAQINQFGTYGVVGADPDKMHVASVVIEPTALGLALDETGQLTATALCDHDLPLDRVITWSSSDEAVATVDETGLVTGVSEGSATITAESEGVSATALVTVAGTVASVTVTPDAFSILEGDSQQLSAEALDPNDHVLVRTFTWSSSDESLATVDSDGLVTALLPGAVTISATADAVTGGATADIGARVVSVEVSPATFDVLEGDAVQLTAAALDARSDEVTATFTWSSDDESVATVDADGLLTALLPGPVTISATTEGVTGTVSTTVGARIVSVEVSPATFEVVAGEEVQLSAVAYDARGDEVTTEFVWTSSDESVATVDETGLVTGVDDGDVTITAAAGGKQGSAGGAAHRVVTISITTPSEEPLGVGVTRQLTAVAYDENASEINARFIWESSDPSVATVNNTGLVEGVARGTANISASVKTGASASLQIRVIPGGGEEEVGGNNLSWPLVFADGVGLGGSPVATDPGVRPSTADADAYAELSAIPVTNPAAEFFYSGNVFNLGEYYLQNTESVWRAQIVDGTGQPSYDASAYWGDNIAEGSASLTVDRPIRIEVALSTTDGVSLMGYSMPYVANPSSPNEIQGTDGSTVSLIPLIYTVGPTLTIEQLDGPGGSVIATVSTGPMSAEINVGGRVVYGGQFRPTVAGTYQLRFTLDGAANVRLIETNSGTVNPTETALEIQVVP